MKDIKKRRYIILDILCMLLIILSGILLITGILTDLFFDYTLESIIYTITSPINGYRLNEVAFYFLSGYAIEIVIGLLAFILKIYCEKKIQGYSANRKERKFRFTILRLYRIGYYCFTICYIIFSTVYVYIVWDVSTYLQRITASTDLYDNYCVQPTEDIIHGENTNNLICIFMESMETQYVYDDMTECACIPNLTELTQINISFGKTDEYAGGVSVTRGATWTMGATLAATSGIPFSLPIAGNSMNEHQYFMPKLVNMGDILQEYGYVQEFLLGSNSSFAGMDHYLIQHGNYEIFDYNTAVERGYTDTYVNWGFDDCLLYDIAKEEATRLYNTGKPFHLAFATMDTHHPEGYVCDICPNTYDEVTANVLSCADSQIYQFLQWMQAQPFYENTTVVIIGDHLRMDKEMVSGLENRKTYNCFINSRARPCQAEEGRIVSTFDLFPSMLAAMGFRIDGDRLGLGTNLFSDKPTLFEELGYDYVDDELSKYSQYYADMYY